MSAQLFKMSVSQSEIPKTRRRLPHWKCDGAIYWVTFRLADSIPREMIQTWKLEREDWLSYHPESWSEMIGKEYEQRFGERIENWLDAGTGSRALAREDVREVVKACFFRFDGEHLVVHSAVVMPTHVHLLIEPLEVVSGSSGNGQTGVSASHSGSEFHDLSKLLKGIEGACARAASRILGTSGTFWLEESFDHIVRSEAQYHHFLQYIAENPVKAVLRRDEYWLMEGGADIPVCQS